MKKTEDNKNNRQISGRQKYLSIMPFDLDKKLPDETFKTILEHCQKGNIHFSSKLYKEALTEFERAVALIPAPQEIWHAFTWLTVASGECYFLSSDFIRSKLLYLKIISIQPHETTNPLIHLRLALCHYKLGQRGECEAELSRSAVPYDISELDHEMFWEIIQGITIRDESLPFNTLV